MNRRIGLLAALCVVAVFSSSCKKKQPMPSPESAAPPIEQFGAPPTEEETRQFAKDLEQAVRDRDAAKVEGLIRIRELMQRTISDFGLSENEMKSCVRGIDKTIKQNSLVTQVLHHTDNGGSYKLLRAHAVDGRQRALFRLIGNDGSTNYHDFIIARFPDGSIGMEDVYVFLYGELISQSARRIMIPIVNQAKGGKGIASDDKDYFDHLTTLAAIGRANRDGKFTEVIANYRQLPRKLQENKSILLAYIMAVSEPGEASDAEYIQAIERFRSLYPNDACINFVSIDYYLLKKDYDAALKAIDRVDQSVGGDPHLATLRANAYMEAKQFNNAREQIETALKGEPNLDSAYWSHITLSLRETNFADTLEWLKKIVQDCKAEIQELDGVPEYADFVKSPRHAEWKKWYAEHKNK